MKTKIFFLTIIAALFCACEEKGVVHVTPENPVIAHLMCIEVTQIPYDGRYYTFNVYDTASEQSSKRAKWEEKICYKKIFL